VRVRRVLHDGDAGSRLPDRVDVGDLPVHVHREDRFRPVGQRRADRGRVHVVGDRVHVDEDRQRARIRDREGRGDAGVGDSDHLVAWPDSERQERQMQRSSPARNADARMRAAVGREFRFECSKVWP